MSFRDEFRDRTAGILSGIWSLGFRVMGRLRPAHGQRFHSPGSRRILVVAAHPDDEIAGCGGTMLLHLDAGDRVRIVVATDGRSSRSLPITGQAMAERRRQEAIGCATALGVTEPDWLDLAENDWRAADLTALLIPIFDDYEPHVVYLPSAIDFHPHHVRVARACADAFDACRPETPEVRIYQSQVPLTATLANLVFPIDGVYDRYLAAFHAYQSQYLNLRRCNRIRRYAGHRYGLAGPAETFWSMSAEDYRILHHRQSPAEQPAASFRGLRDYPLTDPLAYLRGRSARVALRVRLAGNRASTG